MTLDMKIETPFFLPRPVRNERGEGWGEGLFSSPISARPASPPPPGGGRGRKIDSTCMSAGLIQRQCIPPQWLSAAATKGIVFFCRVICAPLFAGWRHSVGARESRFLPDGVRHADEYSAVPPSGGGARKARAVRSGLRGTVLWASAAQNLLILQDDSAGLSVKMNLSNQPPIEAGQRDAPRRRLSGQSRKND